MSRRLGIERRATPGRKTMARSLTRLGNRVLGRRVDRVLREISASAHRRLVRPKEGEIDVVRDVPYLDDGKADHLLDVYRPVGRPGPWPVLLYVHGGGFAFLSKDTHWMMAQTYARHGFLVFTINYRLAPEHPFPAAVEDTFAAYDWVLRRAAAFGGDLSQIVVAGESAGANLITALSVACSYRRPESMAQEVYALDRVPDVAVPACGLFQVSDVERLWRRRQLPRYVQMLLGEVESLYLRCDRSAIDLADPLTVLERGHAPERPLPAFFIPVGTRDPLLDDTRRLARALGALQVPVRARYYAREIHAFHAALVSPSARECWRDTLAFIDQHLHRARLGSARSAI